MKKKNSLLIALILFIVCLVGVVNAADYTIKMSLTSASYLVPGDTVVVDLKVAEINAGNGIDAIAGTIDYDKNVFEEVTANSFEGKNQWNVAIYDKDSQMFTALRSEQVGLPNDVLRITFRVRDGVTEESTTIKVKEIASSGTSASGSTGDIPSLEVKVTINKKTQPILPDVNETVNEIANEIGNEIINQVVNETTNETVNETTNEIVNVITGGNTNTNKINTNTNSNKNETVGKLPQTGEGIELALGILIITIIAIVGYAKYRNMNI